MKKGLIKSKTICLQKVHMTDRKGRERMKKQWKRCMAAAALTLALGIGSGPEMLRAMGTEQEMPGKSGGGYFWIN